MKKNNEASMAIQILPMNEDKKDIIKIVDSVIEYIKSTKLNMVVCPFETVIEGSLDEILDILKKSIKIAEKAGADNFLTYVKISYNKKGVLTIDEKTTKHNE